MTDRIRGRTWMQIRARILRRDEGRCQVCKRNGYITEAREVDHIIPRCKGGSDDDDNLQAICVECHKAKSATDAGKRRRRQIGADGWPVKAGAG